MKKKLIKLLAFLSEGKGITLGNDVFLTGKELDGSDKVYGFVKVDGVINIITRQSRDGYPIEDMDKEDLKYIFKLSAPNIANKIQEMKYEIVEANEV